MNITNRGKKYFPPRILEYRTQVKLASASCKFLSYFCFTFLLAMVVAYFFADQKDQKNNFLLASIIGGISWLVLYLEYLFLLKPLASSKIQVYEDKIIILKGKKETTIPFEEIIEIESSVNKNIGGWFKLVLKDKKTYRFTVVLERLEYILEALIEFNSDLMEKEKYIKLRKKIILLDHGQARSYEMLGKKYRLITFFELVVFPFIFCIFLYYKQSSEFIIHVPFSYFFKLGSWTIIILGFLKIIFFTIANNRIDRNISEQLEKSNKKTRDRVFEHKTYRQLFPTYLCILFILMAGAYKTNINTLGMASLSKGSDYLSIKPGERVWYDSRYNCFDCKHSLIKGDVIITVDDLLVRIVALPRELASVSKKNKEGRFIASTEDIIVPTRSFVISNGKVNILVKDKQIKGKVFKQTPILSN